MMRALGLRGREARDGAWERDGVVMKGETVERRVLMSQAVEVRGSAARRVP
jgi:hypothetical protein